jgi:putative pyruvate formate lyase activating enzyme
MKTGASFSSPPFELRGHGRFQLSRKTFVPAYLRAYEEGRLAQKVDEAIQSLANCRVCPRDCQINRLENKVGICRSGRLARVASAFPHFGEEDCLRGWRGSGTIFFSWCNLKCVFCQNHETSQQGEGTEVTAPQLAGMMLKLQAMGCHNINFVTPEHVVPQILEALPMAIEKGLRLPLVYNTSSYDSLESIRLMDGVVDIYMPDFKLWNNESSRKYLKAADYPETARKVIAAMHQQTGALLVDENGLALRGVLLRHLLMPGLIEETTRILKWVAEELTRDAYVNVMDQYFPAWKVSDASPYREINRPVNANEFATAVKKAREAGLWRLDKRWRKLLV